MNSVSTVAQQLAIALAVDALIRALARPDHALTVLPQRLVDELTAGVADAADAAVEGWQTTARW